MREHFLKKQYGDLSKIEPLAEKLGLPTDMAFLPLKLSIDQSNFSEVMSADASMLYDPFLMKNMREGVAEIKEVVESNGSILIFGDYDADGITASAILKNYFDEISIDCEVCLPTREEGYGLSISKLSSIFKQKRFDLVLTVDCGITAVNEVEFAKKILKTKVIVTDHHEPKEKLPNCTCLNPKLGYPFKDLSGSGVAFKLVEALSCRDTAMKFVDLAAVGTVADVMPMENENRVIVALAKNNVANTGLKLLMENLHIESAGCFDIALKIAPKINACGRVGSPMDALNLLICHNREQCKIFVQKLNTANAKRQKLTEETFADALKIISERQIDTSKPILIASEGWKHGIVGIVANRLLEKFKVPVGVFVQEDGECKGSMRSIEGFSILDALNGSKEFLSKFGGHKLSAGATLSAQVFDEFVADFLAKNHFEARVESFFDSEFCEHYFSMDFFALLEKFQPFLPKDKVVFRGKFSVSNFSTFGSSKQYIRFFNEFGMEFKSFLDFSHLFEALRANCNVEVLFTLDFDSFSKKLVGMISAMQVKNSLHFDDLYLQNYLLQQSAIGKEIEFVKIDSVKKYKDQNCCFVFSDFETFDQSGLAQELSDYSLNFFQPIGKKCVLISPNRDVDLSTFDVVLQFDSVGLFARQEENTLHVKTSSLPSFLQFNVTREVCGRVFLAIKNAKECLNLRELYLACGQFDLTFGQFLAVVRIFQELKLITFKKPFSVEFSGAKTQLDQSMLFNLIAKNNK